MDGTVKNMSLIQPKTMAELLPGLSGILSKDAIQTLTAKKQPRKTMVTRTTEKVIKPLTIAEMKADIMALRVQSPRRVTQVATSSKKKIWNSSVKVENKTKSHTAGGQLKHNPVRKVLNFQSKPNPPAFPRAAIPETPKFSKPEARAKKFLHNVQAKNNVRISGVCKISETPMNNLLKKRLTIANKENNAYQANINRKCVTPKPTNHKRNVLQVPDTPLSNVSWKSSSDTSFLQKEKEIHDIEEKMHALDEEATLEKIAEVSPPVSTPFKEYRNVQEFFNNTNQTDNSTLYNDNTIMCFDKNSITKESVKREESVIVSLCDMLNKATVTQEITSTELDDLLEVEKQIEHDIEMIENSIKNLKNIKESQLKSLQYVRKLIKEKKHKQPMPPLTVERNNVFNKVEEDKMSSEKSPVARPYSVIKSSKSPSYKIPKKNLCLRKKVFCKSMPNVSNEDQTPNKSMDSRALNMYMKMKERMNFLNTPLVKHRNAEIPDTPALTSHNLQKQLDKLFNGS